MITGRPPLTLGTAGHIDHGKTTLVAALTGVDTDRLPEEQARGITIELGYAPLALPGGRRLSVVDVPGHERFVRTMVAGATGVDLYLMTIAADDGVMPQTREHATVLATLGVSDGVVAITKADLHDPAAATAGARELLPGAEVVTCSARTGVGVADVADALQRVAERLDRSARVDTPTVLHVDRVFTIRGAGTVVTGTLWSGSVARGDTLELLPAGRSVRVRGVQVHDAKAERAAAGQRVALNLAGVAVRDVARGDALVDPGSGIAPTLILDAALRIGDARNGTRVQVHHGTRDAPGRLVALSERYWQLRLERPLLAAAGDRLVVRSIAPPDTLGGGVVLDPRARRHGRRPDLVVGRLGRLEHGERPYVDADGGLRGLDVASSAGRREPLPAVHPSDPSSSALALAECLRTAGHEPPSLADLGDDAQHLPALREAGLVVRIGRDMHAHTEAIAAVRERVIAIIEAEDGITLARLRDELQTSRKFAQALLEHLDATRITRRLPDNRRVLRRR